MHVCDSRVSQARAHVKQGITIIESECVLVIQ